MAGNRSSLAHSMAEWFNKGTLLTQGKLQMKAGLVFKEVVAFLFTDALVISNSSSGESQTSYNLKVTLPLKEVLVLDDHRFAEDKSAPFHFVNLSTHTVHTFFAESQESKMYWINQAECATTRMLGDDLAEYTNKIRPYLHKPKEVSSMLYGSRIFNIPLTVVLTKEARRFTKGVRRSGEIPKILATSLDYLEANYHGSRASTNVFRMSDPTTHTFTLRNNFNSGQDIAFTRNEQAASLLMLFLRQLPHGLFPEELLPEVERAGATDALLPVIYCFPKPQYLALLYLMRGLTSICRKGKLKEVEVAEKFAPLLIRGMSSKARAVQVVHYCFKAIPDNYQNCVSARLVQTPPPYLVAINKQKLEKMKKLRERIVAVWKTLQSKNEPSLIEFVGNLRQLLITLNNLVDMNPSLVVELIELLRISTFEHFLYQFEDLWNRMEQMTVFSKFLKNRQLRGAIEKLNANLTEEMSTFDTYIQSIKVKAKTKTIDNKEEESTTNSMREILQDIFKHDEQAKKFWQKAFGTEKFMVPWEPFIKQLCKFTKTSRQLEGAPQGTDQLLASEEKAIKYILDNSNTGYVNIYKFSEYLKGFGPIGECIIKVRQTLQAQWFHGFLSNDEAAKLLEIERAGTFVVRFSESKPGNFAVNFVYEQEDGSLNPKASRIWHSPEGLKIQEYDGIKCYSSIKDLIAANNHFFVFPYAGEMHKKKWFYGDISKEQADDLLKAQPVGTYLLRFSRSPGSVTLSYTSKGGIEHIRIQRGNEKGIEHFGVGEDQYNTLEDLIEAYPQLFVKPLENVSATPVSGTKSVLEGSVEKLIDNLYDGTAAQRYTTVFLLTYRTFTTPHRLIEILQDKYLEFANLDNTRATSSVSLDKVYRLRIISFINRWMSRYFFDFESDVQLVSKIKAFFVHVKSCDGTKLYDRISSTLNNKLNNTKAKYIPKFAKPPPAILVPKHRVISKAGDIHPFEIARQITFKFFELFKAIQVKECMGLAFSKKGKEKNSPNLIKMIAFSNHISAWTITEILKSNKYTKRAKVIDNFIVVAKELHRLNNFEGAMQLVAAFANSAVDRLKRTWSKVNKTRLMELQTLKAESLSIGHNYANLRKEVANGNPPLIPFTGILLTDLTKLDEGAPNKTPTGKINFHKREKLAEILEKLLLYQQCPYNLLEHKPIIEYIEDPNVLDDSSAFKKSRELEPPEK